MDLDEVSKADLVARIEELEEQQQQLKKQTNLATSQNDRVLELFEQFKTGMLSRRGFLASVSAIAGVGIAARSGSAAVNPNWSSATGNSGTENTPLANIFAKNAYHQSLTTDQTSIGRLALQSPPTKVISSGVISLDGTESYIHVDGEGDTNDTIETISGGDPRQMLLLRPADADNITISHNTGNILTDGQTDKTLDSNRDRMLLFYDNEISLWTELAFSNSL